MKKARDGGGGRRKAVSAAEAVVAFFNHQRRAAGDVLRENERLRARIRRLEDQLGRDAATGREGGDKEGG